MIFNEFIDCSIRVHKILPKTINEHKFSLLSIMFSLALIALVCILKNTVYMLKYVGRRKESKNITERND
jgi:hypothetical protein